VSDIHKILTFRATPRLPKRPRYKGSRKARLWRLRAQAIALSLTISAATGGCSMSYKLDSFLGKDSAKPEATAAIKPAATAAALPAGNDLDFAKAAAVEVLARTDKGASVPWENPGTGARGSVTPIADAYTQDGFQCRDFLASYIRDGAEAWLQGDGCRVHQGKWTVRNLRPLKRT
jgi:surface antigen